MNQKTNNLDATEINETIRKSKLTASDEFEFRKLCRKQEGFLECSIEDDGENIRISYNAENLALWTYIRKEKRELVLSALEDVGRLSQLAKLYKFSLNPENLYYDIQGRVYVKARDIYGEEEEYSEEEFLKGYKSLIGCTLIKKYRFEDYENGGQDLLNEDGFLRELALCEDALQVVAKLHEEYDRYTKQHCEKYMEITRISNRNCKVLIVVMAVVLAIAAALAGYLVLWERPYEHAVIAANEAYLESDYGGVVEAMADVDVERMNGNQKYILAVSCVKCESFNDENMRNILNTITLNGDEKVMEYWIYINRLDTKKAADIAMQESSSQLLYYAYLKEKAVVENDSSLTGEEKNAKLSDIENKLKPLEEEYSTLTEE